MDIKENLDTNMSLASDASDAAELINENSDKNNRIVSLTTIDNPYDPIDDFDEWFAFDMQKGYNTCAYLARIADDSNKFTDEEMYVDIEEAIDEIIKYDPIGLYIKAVRESK